MAKSRRRSNNKIGDESPKVKINKENLSQALILFRYLKPFRFKFTLSLVFIALSAFTTSLFPLFLGKMIDAAMPGAQLTGVTGNMNNNFGFDLKAIHWSLNTTLLLIFLQLAFQTVFSYMRVYLLTEVGEKSLANMRRDVYSKLLCMPMSFFSERRVGDLSNRISPTCRKYRKQYPLPLQNFSVVCLL